VDFFGVPGRRRALFFTMFGTFMLLLRAMPMLEITPVGTPFLFPEPVGAFALLIFVVGHDNCSIWRLLAVEGEKALRSGPALGPGAATSQALAGLAATRPSFGGHFAGQFLEGRRLSLGCHKQVEFDG